MVEQDHDCEASVQARRATKEFPYHFVESGLPNVYLVGIRYFVCQKCQKQSAEIPAVNQLLRALARTLVEKGTTLTGEELRFLRKRLRKKAIEMAEVLAVEPEHYSRLETGKLQISAASDKIVRAYYALQSSDPMLKKSAVLKQLWETRSKSQRTANIAASLAKGSQWKAGLHAA